MKKLLIVLCFACLLSVGLVGCKNVNSSSSSSGIDTSTSTVSSDSSSSSSSSSSSAEPTPKLEIYFLEMNYLYGDSIFMKCGDIDILIDAGWAYDGGFVRDFIRNKVTDGKLELLMASHAHGDHIGGLPTALSVINKVDLIIDFGELTGSSGEGYGDYKNCRDAYIADGASYYSAYNCVTNNNTIHNISDKLSVEILNTGNYVAPNVERTAGNERSVACIFTYGDFKFYTAGDLTESGERVLVNNNRVCEVTLAKASHHGSSGSNSTALFNVLKPKMFAISAARAGRYNYQNTGGTPLESDLNTNLQGTSGHPHGQAIQRMYASEYIKENKNVYWNMYAGNMCFSTDGSTDLPTFTGSVPNRGYYDKDTGLKVSGEENFKLSETKVFKYRLYGFDDTGSFTFV